MTRRAKCRILLVLLVSVGGCANLTDKDGKRISLREYDSVVVERVTIVPEAPYPEMVPCLQASLELELLASEEWLKARQPELRQLLSAAGRDDPFDPASPHSDTQRLQEQDKWQERLKKQPGSRPVRLRAEITKVHFPSWSSMTVLGSTSYAYCQVELFDREGAEPLGGARVFSAPEFPRLGVWNAALPGVLTNLIRYKEYKHKDRLILARDIARQIVRALNRAKRYQARKAEEKAPKPADRPEAG